MNRPRLICVLVGLVVLLGVAVGYRSRPSGGLEIVDATRRELALEEKRPVRLVFVVRNTSSRPLRLLGMEGSCTKAMCFGPADEIETMTVPANGSVELCCKVVPRGHGAFEQTRIVYLEDHDTGVRQTSVTIAGTILAAGSAPPSHEIDK